MKKILYIFLTLLSVQVSAQIEQPRIKFDQVIKDSTGSGRIVISSLDDSSMIYSPDFFINTADSLLILFGDTVQAGSAVDAAQVRDIIYATIDAGLGVEIDTSSQLGILTIQSLSIEDSVYNSTGTLIAKGTPLYVAGIQGNYWSVAPAQANDSTKMPVVAIAGEDIAAGQQGLGLLKGHIKGVNTELFAAGDEIWVGATGGYTNVRPKGEDVLVQKLGTVVKANANGSGIINLGEVQYNLNPNNIFIGGADSVQTTVNLPTVLSDSLNNYVTIAGTDTITGAKTFTSDLNIDAKIALNAGDDNIVIGDIAGASLVSGQAFSNVLVGTQAGAAIDSGSYNVAIGVQTLLNNKKGSYNVANGFYTLRSNTTGSNNIANGRQALEKNTTGISNIANGTFALNKNIDGEYNAANGHEALFSNTSGDNNVAIGRVALYSNQTGDNNIAIGRSALAFLSSGSNNQAYGYQAGSRLSDNSTPLDNANGSLFIGSNTQASANGNSGEIVIGTSAIGNGSNTITIGSISAVSLHTRNYEFDIDQTVSASEDNYVLTYDNADGQISLEPRVESAAFQQQFTAGGTSYTVTTADLPVDINNILVFQNGQVLDKTMFTKSGNTIILNFQPEVGDRIIVMWFKGDIVDIGGNYVTLDQTETITGAKTFTDTVVLQTYNEGVLSVDAGGTVKTEPTFRNLSLGEGYADVAKEYHYSDGKTVYPSDLGYNYAELLQADVLSKTSLILTPTAIATGVVASQKPLSSDGDFTFTRSTSATRVNENGYIEKETQNLLLQSNTFNTTWGKSGGGVITLTSGQSGYDGSNDAWLLEKTATGFAYINQSISYNGVNTLSIYAKAGTNTTMSMRFLTTVDGFAYFDLSAGTITSTSSAIIDSNIEAIGNGWYRCSITINASNNNAIFIYPEAPYSGTTAGSIYIQDAQLEQGLVARDYIETTTAAVYGGVTDSVPRIDYTDYLNPSLLLEPQRSNLVEHSEYFGAYPAGYQTRIANATTSPEGLQNAYKLTATQDFSSLGATYSLSASTTYTASVYVKNISAGTDITSNTFPIRFTVYDYTNSTTILSEQYLGDISTSEWRRLTFSFTTTTAASVLIQFVRDLNNTEEVYIYGAQLEAGSYPTSYIPTYGTAVTRNADNCNNGGNSDLFNDSEGVLYVEIASLIDDNEGSKSISISSGGYSDNIIIQYTTNTNQIVFKTSPSYTTPIFQPYNVSNITQNSKIAFKYKLNDCSFWHNGVKLGSVTSFTPFSSGTLRQLNFDRGEGNEKFEGNVKQILYFPTALTDAELAELTKQ